MKRIFILISIFLLTLSLLFLPQDALAACNEFFIDPSSGNSSTVFTVTARGCTAGNYTAEIQMDGGTTEQVQLSEIQGQYVGTVGTLPNGQFAAILRENGTIVNQDVFQVSQDSGDGSGGGGTTGDGTAGEVQCQGQPGTVSTAIGCVPINDINTMARFFLGWALGIAGGVALLMIGLAGFRIATSQGNPQRLQGGQELLMSAIGGLLMVVLSVYLLRFIGVDLLGLFS